MPKVKKQRGRPVTKVTPERINASPEELAKALFALPADHEWEYMKQVNGGTETKSG